MPGLVNVDFEDVKTVMSEPGKAMMPIPLQRNRTDYGPGHSIPIHAKPVPAHDYAALSTPSVWRSGRSAAAKVDARASNGMDEIEIPAFFRKQAD